MSVFRSVPFLRSDKSGAASPLYINGKRLLFGKDFGFEFVSGFSKSVTVKVRNRSRKPARSAFLSCATICARQIEKPVYILSDRSRSWSMRRVSLRFGYEAAHRRLYCRLRSDYLLAHRAYYLLAALSVMPDCPIRLCTSTLRQGTGKRRAAAQSPCFSRSCRFVCTSFAPCCAAGFAVVP